MADTVYTFEVPSQPVPAARPRLGRGRQAHTPARTIEAEEEVAYHFTKNFGFLPEYHFEEDAPLFIEVDYYFDRQVITVKRHPTLGLSQLRGDVDNYAKTTLDGLAKGSCFKNDRTVVEFHGRKWPKGV
jgi:Holliday junction resolvase RusA-like endonuclease